MPPPAEALIGAPPAATGRALRFAAWLASLLGWRRYAAAFAFGAAATFALPPAYFIPALLLSFPALLFLMNGVRSWTSAFGTGWWFGFGHHMLGLYWIAAALFTDLERFGWLIPVGASGMPIILSMFTGAAMLLFWLVPSRGLGRVVALAVCWGAMEWARGHFFTGFPWNLTGYAWVGYGPVLQSTAWIGIYGLSLLTVLAAAMPAALIDPAVPQRSAVAALAGCLVLFVAIGIAGHVRLSLAGDGTVPGVRLRLVQGNISQHQKRSTDMRLANFIKYLKLSAQYAGPAPTHIIWPETAVPFFLANEAEFVRAIATVTPPGGLTITGALRMTTSGSERHVFNGLEAIDHGGSIVATYDKFHLVPFGEYMPLRSILPLDPIAAGAIDFSAGPGPRSLHLPGVPPVSPLICYEVIFPGNVTDRNDRPAWLLNITNDGWYGQTAGPHQHLAIARVRAVEEGLPLVRAANTGISAVVDPYGRFTAYLELGREGIVDAALPASIDPTLYSRLKDLIFFILLFSGGIYSLYSTYLRRNLLISHHDCKEAAP